MNFRLVTPSGSSDSQAELRGGSTEPVAPGNRQVRGSVGDGSAFFELATFTGDIKVTKKDKP